MRPNNIFHFEGKYVTISMNYRPVINASIFRVQDTSLHAPVFTINYNYYNNTKFKVLKTCMVTLSSAFLS